jgi:hypothetical protein
VIANTVAVSGDLLAEAGRMRRVCEAAGFPLGS